MFPAVKATGKPAAFPATAVPLVRSLVVNPTLTAEPEDRAVQEPDCLNP